MERKMTNNLKRPVDNVKDSERRNALEWMSSDGDESEKSSNSTPDDDQPTESVLTVPAVAKEPATKPAQEDQSKNTNLAGPPNSSEPKREQSQVEHRMTENSEKPKTEQFDVGKVVLNPIRTNTSSTARSQSQFLPSGHRLRSGHKGFSHSLRSQQGAKNAWADRPSLISTEDSIQQAKREAEARDRAQYLSARVKNEEMLSFGYYLWEESTDPVALLGSQLEDLNQIRVTHKVFIELSDGGKSLEISSRLQPIRAVSIITDAINAIRRAIKASKVAYKRSAPIYIVVPPPSKLYRQKVEPVLVGQGSTTIKSLILCGDELARHEVARYESERAKQLVDNVQLLRDHLIEHVSTLSYLRNWMRMRINFGTLKCHNATKGIYEKKFNVGDVRSMMSSRRFRGEFDKRIGDAQVAMTAIKNILKKEKIFSFMDLGEGVLDYKRKHTEVIFIKTPDGQRRRVEAEVDIVDDWTGINARHTPHGKETMAGYQIGGVKLFHDSNRNKLVEVTCLDFEHELQWNLDVVTDSSVLDIPSAVYTLVESSVTVKTEGRRDALELIYPAVAPIKSLGPGIEVEEVVLKTVAQFPIKNSSYIVEVTIYRRWSGCNTKPEPETSCAISMRNYRWDSAMVSTEDSLQERDWQPQLKDFFPPDAEGGDGFVDLVDQIQRVRHILTAKS
ncbi:hypothetical protein PVAG01_07199 [Phlyctema vagabunda]|uniref:DUF7905 domain-containing protein n=1 Tax=Phlyctema vagabunda TaxID=108571 RepID=A0ABR4PBS5_9HELO